MPYIVRSDRRAFFQERPWVVAGGAALSVIAGYVNVVLLGVFHVPVSHMSGAVSRLGMDLAEGNAIDTRMVLGIIGGFMLGAAASGAVIGGRQLLPGRRYGLVLFLDGTLLALATSLLSRNHRAGVAVAAIACGMHNAMASSYHGLVLRTSHVTGVVTDIGVLFGHWVRHKEVELWKFAVLWAVLGGFFTGGMLGAVAYRTWGVGALWVAALSCFLAGAGYSLWKQFHRSWLPHSASGDPAAFWRHLRSVIFPERG